MTLKNKLVIVGSIVAVIVICVFIFAGNSNTGVKVPVFANDYEKAQAAMEAGEPEQAIELLKKYTSENPENADGWRLLGDAYKSIETFEYPVGMRFEALKAYYEGYLLKDDGCRRRLMWEISPYVVKFGEGNSFRTGSIPMSQFEAWIEEEANKQSESGQTDQNSELEIRKKLFIFASACENSSMLSGLWFLFIENKDVSIWDVTLDDQLFVLEMMEYDRIFDWEILTSLFYANDLWKYWPEEDKEDLVYRGLQENNPKAAVMQAIGYENWTQAEYYRSLDGLPELYKNIIEKLEPQKDKIDNLGKLMLAEAYVYSEGKALSDASAQKVIDLAKSAVKGPYAVTNIPARILMRIKFPQSELDKIIEAVKTAHYGGNATWGDVIDKIDSVKWRDAAPKTLNSRLYQYALYCNWLTRGIVLNGTYEGKDVEIYFPVRYNSLKDRWECVTGRGAISVKKPGNIVYEDWRTVPTYIDTTVEQPDRLEPWMNEIFGLDTNVNK